MLPLTPSLPVGRKIRGIQLLIAHRRTQVRCLQPAAVGSQKLLFILVSSFLQKPSWTLDVSRGFDLTKRSKLSELRGNFTENFMGRWVVSFFLGWISKTAKTPAGIQYFFSNFIFSCLCFHLRLVKITQCGKGEGTHRCFPIRQLEWHLHAGYSVGWLRGSKVLGKVAWLFAVYRGTLTTQLLCKDY